MEKIPSIEKTSPTEQTIEDIAVFCKRKGFVYASGELYGGLTGFFDYGPFGSQLKKNIREQWWSTFITGRDDIVAIDASLITHPTVWKASGHVDSFEDILTQDLKTGEKFRADHLVEQVLQIPTDGLNPAQLDELIEKHHIKSPKGNALGKCTKMNLMFQTYVGPAVCEENKAYLRPETAQMMFANFKNIVETTRVKLPFGIAQIGKSFRNEISPRNFIFRLRELEQAEIEYFVHPDSLQDCPYIDQVSDIEVSLNTEYCQKNNKPVVHCTIEQALAKKYIKTPWHAFFIGMAKKWFTDLGVQAEHLRFRQHLSEELSHYSSDTWDLEYKFPFGFKELWGIADRGTFDLTQHAKFSKKDISLFDEATKTRIVPRVIEPALGVDRAFLVFICEGLTYDATRENYVLKIHPKLAPITCGVFPLMKKDKLPQIARELVATLRKNTIVCQFDDSGTVGKRYSRMDELGTPYCITVDFDTLTTQEVTIRDRDTAKQIRVKIDAVVQTIRQLQNGEMSF